MPELSEADFIAEAKKRFTQCEEDERELRLEAGKDLDFLAGEQWDKVLAEDRIRNRRPVMKFNRLPVYVQSVANEARQNKAQAKFAPSDDDATEETAKVFEGIARHIQYASDANIASENALDYAVGCSFGFYKFLTDYADDDSDDQELKMLPVYDPFSVYGVLIPSIYGRPVNYAFEIEDIPKDQYKRDYPDSSLLSTGWDDAKSSGWANEDTVRVAGYWYVEETSATSKSGRKIKKRAVKFCKMNSSEILPNSKTDWLGSTIPIIPVLGKQMIVKGKPKLFSLIRFQRDPQQLINYGKTRIAETLSTAPISPYIGAVGSFAGREAQWQKINTALQSFVEYNVVDSAGKPLPPPQRQVFEPPIASLSEFVAQEVDDLKAIAGIFDQSLGEGTNDQSGTAIKSRQRQSNATNLHFNDNLERALKAGGKVIAELIPEVYGNGPRIVEILGENEEPDIVKVGQSYQDPSGQSIHHDLSKGKYKLIITVGKSFSSKRQESFEMMSEVVTAHPELMMVVGDIFFKNSDTAGADQMSDRFKRFIQLKNPGIIEDENEPIPPQAQAKIAQSQQQLQMMHAYAQQQEQEVQKLQQEKQAKIVDNQFKLSIEKMKIEADLAKAEIITKAQSAQVRMKLENDMWNELHGSAHEVATQAVDHAHEQDMATQGHRQTLEQGDQAAANQSALQQQQAEQQPQEGA